MGGAVQKAGMDELAELLGESPAIEALRQA
jgi:hypothetical protein